MRKEPELMQEVEQYQLDIVGLTSMHDTGSGSKILPWMRGLGRYGDNYEPLAERHCVGVLPREHESLQGGD